MELCLSTSMWRDRPLPEALERARVAGIDALDLDATPESPHLNPLEGPDAVRAALEGWRVLALTAAHPDLPRHREEGGAEAVGHTIAAIRCAEALGARVVGTSLGSTDIDAWETAWSRSIEGLREVLRQTSRSSVRLAVELSLDDVFNSLRKARRLFEEIPSPRLGLLLDTSLLYYLRIDSHELFKAVGDRITHVHLRDATRREFQLSIGHGEVRFPEVLRLLRGAGYTGALSIELERTQERHGLAVEEALAESVPRVREWLTTPP